MTEEEIIEMASEAGFTINELHCSPPIISFIGNQETIEAFAKLIKEKEREECAKWFEGIGLQSEADAVRARGKE